MHFANPIPWWLVPLVAAGVVALAFAVYRRPLVPLSLRQRGTLITLRALSLAFLIALLCRPVVSLAPTRSGDVVVPILIDASRSMQIEDADGQSRHARARGIADEISAALSPTAHVEWSSFADGLTPFDPARRAADGRKTNLRAAVQAVEAKYRGQRVAGVVLLSDGGATQTADDADDAQRGIPIFAVGVGSIEGPADREITGLSAGDPKLDQASADVRVTAVSRGFGREPFTLRVLADGQVMDTRRVTPVADGAPIEELFTVFPNPTRASLYAVEIETAPHEAVVENNRRALAISPAGRRRRVLMMSGAPGYDHSFLLRAMQQDPGLDVDVLVRKGKNDANEDTFLVQAGGTRAALLTRGFPASKEALFDYDAIVVANLEADFFSREQLAQLAAFVGQRGGGLLLTGGRSFERRGLAATALEEVLPVELTDRRGGPLRAASGEEGPTGRETIALTDEGLRHPVMRIGKVDQLKTLWGSLPPLASAAALGGPRPGAAVLAVTTAPNGAVLPVVAVQQYGRGRAMIFGGEASWRWRMLQPAADRRYDFFWRQAVRWLANDAPGPVSTTIPASIDAGDELVVQMQARDREFALVDAADFEVRVTTPAGQTSVLAIRPSGRGEATAFGEVAVPGLYRVQTEARRHGTSLGVDDRWVAVGDNEKEFADPRLNEGTLQRLARHAGGRYVRAADAASLVDELRRAVPAASVPQQRDLWHHPMSIAFLIVLLTAEWGLRRSWGLR